MGIYANAVGDGALAIGHGSSTGVSVDVTPSGKQGTAEYADGFWTTSIQTDSTGNPIPNGKDGGIAIGSYAHTEGTRAMAVGRVAGAYGTNSMAIGLRSNAYGEGSMAFGHGVTAGSADQKYAAQVAELHDDPTIPYDLDGADGIVSLDNVIGAIAMGSYAEATGRGSLSMGRYSKAQSAYSTAMGIRAVVSADAVNGVAIGREATVEGANSIAIGKQATVTGSDSIAIGTGHTVSGSNSGAIGDPSVISGDNSYAVGNNNTIGDYDGAFIMGNSSDVSASGGVILGSNATVTAEGGVALGDGSAATVGAGVFGYDPLTDKPSTETSAAWKSGAGAVSVGSGDVTRQITNVAAGTNDTDAVNVAQLKRIALTAGEGVSIDEDNKINIDAVTRYAGDFGEQVSVSLDNVLTVKGSAASEKDLTTGNIGVVTDPESQALLVKLNKDVDLGEDGSVKIGNVSISSTNVSMGGNRITNVAPGVNPTDAVNMSQLMGFTGGWYLAVADGEADKIAGDTVRIVVEKNEPVGDLTTDVLSVKKTVNDDGEQVVSFVVADAPTFGGMVTAGGLTVKAKSGDVVINNDGISAGGNKITNVAKGDVNKNSTDAVNGSQLFDLGDSVAQSFGGTSVYNSSTGKVEFNVKLDETGTQNSVAEALQALDTKPVYKHDITMEKNLTVGGTFTSNGPAVFNETVTMKKGLNMSGTRITNLAPGVDDGDAVNVSQLKAIGSNINYQINKMDRDISYTGSRAAALAALHPLPYDPDKPTSIMAGVGHYRGASSVALGVAHHFNDDTLLTVGSTVGRETMLNVGLSLRVGRNTNMTEKRWKAMRYSAANYDAKIKTLEEENSSLRKRLKSLENSVQTLLDAKGRK
jgi:autotransporter adhesin